MVCALFHDPPVQDGPDLSYMPTLSAAMMTVMRYVEVCMAECMQSCAVSSNLIRATHGRSSVSTASATSRKAYLHSSVSSSDVSFCCHFLLCQLDSSSLDQRQLADSCHHSSVDSAQSYIICVQALRHLQCLRFACSRHSLIESRCCQQPEWMIL